MNDLDNDLGSSLLDYAKQAAEIAALFKDQPKPSTTPAPQTTPEPFDWKKWSPALWIGGLLIGGLVLLKIVK